MRQITKATMSKRGCNYCTDYRKTELDSTKKKRHACIHDDGCPYHELDPYDSYLEYLKHAKNGKFFKMFARGLNT